jgi:hypothetical protein
MPILDVIQQHLDNDALALAHEAAVAAGLLVTLCMSCGRIKGSVETPHAGISHGIHEGACLAAYRAKYGRRVA